ncbi:hypothetical protein RB594_003739 [Gaeumannomyces avenae]
MATQSLVRHSGQPPPPAPGENNARGDGKPLLDFGYIDTQYSNQEGKDNPVQYGQQPWRYVDDVSYTGDVANAYLSIRFDRREEFMRNLEEPNRTKVKREIDRINKALGRFQTYTDKQAMFEDLKSAREEWRSEVNETLSKRRNDVEEKHTQPGQQLERRDRYRERYRALLERLESKARCQPGGATTTPEPIVASGGILGPEIPEASETPKPPEPLGSDCGFKARVMYFKQSSGPDGDMWEGFASPHAWYKGGKFPHQKISAQKLLDKDGGNPLIKSEDEGLRWFHFPVNNMSWVEKAMARYYGEEDLVCRAKPHSEMSEAERLLCREFWGGQLHGSGEKAPIHARHMRSRFFLIPRKPSTAAAPSAQDTGGNKAPQTSPHATGTSRKTKENIALFIPYLHWEANGRRRQMVQAMNNADGIPKARQKAIERKTLDQVVEKTRPREIRTKLGKYLLHLAQVAEAIDSEMDEKLLRENLYKDPPQHLRRTLDQYHFPTIEDTSVRDMDQVVFRETWDRSGSYGRSTRVVMVDQLWLWILDDNTIITSFPRRWGRNKPDPSGVHKCLRDRLANNSTINSIYHLALMIIDQCSNVFFDRTKPLDQRPEVIDIFNSAIGNVTDLTAIAYDSFWFNASVSRGEVFTSGLRPASSSDTQRESKKTGKQRGSEKADEQRTSEKNNPWYLDISAAGTVLRESKKPSQRYLDINPAGTLLREGRDIAEELKIMHRIFSQQWQVVKDFRRYLGQLARCRRGGEKEALRLLFRTLGALSREEADDDGGLASPMPCMQSARWDESNADPGLWLETTLQEADMLRESIESRQAEIQDLEDSARRTNLEIESLLSLKQQQASIVEAKAALESASETVKQGRSIMAFTIVTIFFLPLGFFAGFFGMNNQLSTGNEWMTLGEQIKYMFALSAAVITISVLIAFNSFFRTLLSCVVRIPLLMLAQWTGFWVFWDSYGADLEKKASMRVGKLKRERVWEKEAREKAETKEAKEAREEKAEAKETKKRFEGTMEAAAARAALPAPGREHGNVGNAGLVERPNGSSTAAGEADVESGRRNEPGSSAAGWFSLRSRGTRGAGWGGK